MEDLETRKARRVEQVVAKWLRRSRDHSGRGRASVSDGPSDGNRQPATVKLTVEVQKDVLLGHYGIEVSHNLPLLITSVAAGSTADGKLLPGDRILAINNDAAEDIAGEQAAAFLRESQDTLQFTVLRCTSGGPKSSFLTAEKRARLKTNPVKVHFAEEVVMNEHNQGSSLLCMPNVLKVYLENGQTKAFKFEANTTVKDIILTLKEKLSIQNIEHFALVLEERHNMLKMYLLHEDELIERVVQRKESRDYRCLFRVCFIPRDPLHLLQQDPVAFEYLYLQSCSDVLRERFAVEMKCSVALRLSALHIQERIITCAQPQKISLKYIEKDWGIENFISPTLLRNMRGKDIKKAISFHMKRNQLLLDPRQKHHLSAAQVRLCYLQILGDLKLYGGKVFNVTLMLQDRESCIALLVGAKYGISQVVNSKLNVVAILAEFANISRLELTKESDKVSMVKIYLQDIKKKRKKEKEPLYQVLTVLLESNSAKDLACLISGYYRMFVDSSNSIFIWGERKPQMHRFSAEEGYESRTCSDSEESSELDSSLDRFSDTQSPKYSSISPPIEEEGEQQGLEQEKKNLEAKGMSFCNGYNMSDSLSEASDSANTESRGLKSSGSSDSLDALEEDDLEACSASRPEIFQFCPSALQKLASNDKMLFGADGDEGSRTLQENFFSFLLPPLGLPQPEEESRRENGVSILESKLAKSNTMEYYSLCANLSPASSAGKNTQSGSPESCSLQEPEDPERISEGQAHVFDHTNSVDNFCDATEGMAPTEPQAGSGVLSPDCSPELPSYGSLDENILARQSRRMKPRPAKEPTTTNNLRKRRSFLQTNYTSQVSFPKASYHALKNTEYCNTDSTISGASYSPAVTLLKEPQQASNLLEATEQIQMAQNSTSSSDSTEMGQNSSVPNSVLCLASAQADGGSLDSTRHSLNSFNMPTYQSRCLSTPGITFHLEDLNPTCKEKPEKLTEIPNGIQGHCEIKAECSVNQALDKKVNTSKAVSPTGVSYVLIEEIIHTTTKPSGSQSSIQDKPLSYASHLDQDPFPAEKVEKQEHVMLDPCKRVKSDPILYESSQALGDLKLEEGISQLSSKGATQKLGDEKYLGYSNVTEPFFNCSDKSGSETCCWPDSSSAVKNAEICQQADNECQGITGQNVLSINHLSLKDGVLNRVPACLSAMSMSQNLCQSTDVAGDYKTEGKNLTGDALIMDYKKKRPSSLMASSGEYIEQSKTDNLPGQGYCSSDMLSKAARSSEKKCTLDLPFLPSDNATRDAMAFNDTGPPGVVNSEETFTPEPKLERCSCQLSYASCFHGVENEAELDCTKSLASSMSEGPLTTPPSTRNPLPSDFNPTRHLQEPNYRDGIPRDSQHHKCLPELPIKELSYMKEKWSVLPFDFCHLLGNVVELQEMLRWFSGNQKKHPEDKCSALFSENKNALYMESQRLLSNCQKIIKAHGPSSETQIIIQETFQNLLQLTEVCLEFTNCGLCSSGHVDLKANLRDVLCNYQRFLEACRQTHEKDYSSLSLKLRVCEYTALAASLFCLVHQFRASSST